MLCLLCNYIRSILGDLKNVQQLEPGWIIQGFVILREQSCFVLLYISTATGTQCISLSLSLASFALYYHDTEWFTIFWKDTQKAMAEFLDVLYFLCPLHATSSSHGPVTEGGNRNTYCSDGPSNPQPPICVSLSLFSFRSSSLSALHRSLKRVCVAVVGHGAIQ